MRLGVSNPALRVASWLAATTIPWIAGAPEGPDSPSHSPQTLARFGGTCGNRLGPGIGDHPGMDDPGDYELLDAGDGRRLERFGARVADRPAPAATGPRSREASWDTVDLRFERHRGWRGDAVALAPWTVRMGTLTLELRSTETGQVGLFPEQRPVWQWLTERVAEVTGDPEEPPPVLNLFGYTGAA